MEQAGPFCVVVVGGFERTDVSKKADARRTSSLAGASKVNWRRRRVCLNPESAIDNGLWQRTMPTDTIT
jgi:hypothetical protein